MVALRDFGIPIAIGIVWHCSAWQKNRGASAGLRQAQSNATVSCMKKHLSRWACRIVLVAACVMKRFSWINEGLRQAQSDNCNIKISLRQAQSDINGTLWIAKLIRENNFKNVFLIHKLLNKHLSRWACRSVFVETCLSQRVLRRSFHK